MKQKTIIFFIVTLLVSPKTSLANFISFDMEKGTAQVQEVELQTMDFNLGGSMPIGGGKSIGVDIDPRKKNDPSARADRIISGKGLKFGLDASSKYLDETISHHSSLPDLIVGWTNFLLPFVSSLAILGLIVGAVFLITGFGNDSLYQKGRKIILCSIIGIVLIYSAYPIIHTIIGAGMDDKKKSFSAGVNF